MSEVERGGKGEDGVKSLVKKRGAQERDRVNNRWGKKEGVMSINGEGAVEPMKRKRRN